MKSKRTVLLVLMAAIIISSKPVFAKESSNKIADNGTTISISSKEVNADKVATLSEKDKAKISQEQAKEIAKNALKDYFEISIDDTKFQSNVNFNSNYFGGEKSSVWNISWYSPNEDKQTNLNVAVDGITGKVLSINTSEYDRKQTTSPIATITPEEAKEKAEAFLKRINPEQFKNTTPIKDNNFMPNYGPGSYSFGYNRIINNVPFDNNNIRVSVDGVTGKVTCYEIKWDDDVKTPDSDKAIDQKQAEDIFDKNIKMNLNYNSYMNRPSDSQENKTKLVYAPDSSSTLVIDATSGKALTWNGDSMESVKTRNITDNQKEDILKNAKPVQILGSPISSERAEQVIKEKIKELCGDGYEINSVNYEENSGYMGMSQKVWSGNFQKKDKDTNFGPPDGRIAINALTEQIVNIDKFNFNDKQDEKFEPKVTWEQAYDKAIQFIAKNCPERIKEINTEQKNLTNSNNMYTGVQNNRFIAFNFGRIVNGVAFNTNGMPYNNNGIIIVFDSKTGEINSFAFMWQDSLELPSVTNTISNDDAKKTFLNANKPQLIYLLTNKVNNMDKSNSKVQLVYSIGNLNNPLSNVDAVTGKMLNFYGDNVEDNIDTFKAKIKGSAVEKEATILASQGIIDTKDFKLDGGITRLQLVKILVNAKGFNPYLKGMNDVSFTKGVGAKDSTDYKYVQFAVTYGIIQDKKEEFKGNELVTREELATSLVKLLGYDKIAEIKGLLNTSYSDKNTISEDKAGYVSLAGGLKLIEANSDGKIRPKDNVTMSELIKAVYAALGNLQK